MEAPLSPVHGYVFLGIFGVTMVAITGICAHIKQWNSIDGFLVAGREVHWILGGFSIAASWIWAPALFVSVQIAHQSGIAGAFWFAAPNMLALALFALLAPRIRECMPQGYTLPQYMQERLNSKRVHRMYLFPYFFYQIMAVTVQLFAGGNLVSLLTGIPLAYVMPMLASIALAYTLVSGLEASIITDVVQMLLIICVGSLILPMTWHAAGGIDVIQSGLGGVDGIESMLDPQVAFSFGIVTAIGLLAGAMSDQQYWQRAFAIKKHDLPKAFIFGAILFGIVPIALSTLGFLGASPELHATLPEGIDASMIGVQVIAMLLPNWATVLFVVMLLAGLCSTLDSALSATSTLWVTDVRKEQSDTSAIFQARIAMVGITIIGLTIAYAVYGIPSFGLKELWWIFNTIAACIALPTLLSLYWSKLDERGVFWGVLSSFIVGIPAFVYANIAANPTWIVAATILVVAMSTSFCVLMPKRG